MKDAFDKFQSPDRGRFGDNELAPERTTRGPRVTGASDLKDLELKQHVALQDAVVEYEVDEAVAVADQDPFLPCFEAEAVPKFE